MWSWEGYLDCPLSRSLHIRERGDGQSEVRVVVGRAKGEGRRERGVTVQVHIQEILLRFRDTRDLFKLESWTAQLFPNKHTERNKSTVPTYDLHPFTLSILHLNPCPLLNTQGRDVGPSVQQGAPLRQGAVLEIRPVINPCIVLPLLRLSQSLTRTETVSSAKMI